jgi:ABC-type dipeptide/oligopeptide/nickel transport system permease component
MRYVVRPASAALIAGWLNSIRVVIGALPLVEFFFAYPGVGQMLLFSIGIHYRGVAGTPGAADPDLAIAAALFLAGLLLVLESVALSAQALLDPRIRETRAA